MEKDWTVAIRLCESYILIVSGDLISSVGCNAGRCLVAPGFSGRQSLR